jgi:hypothetical protein
MITKSKQVDETTIAANGTVLLKESITVTDDDGSVLAVKYKRDSYAPGSVDVTEIPKASRAIVKAAWTDDILTAYNTKIATNENNV